MRKANCLFCNPNKFIVFQNDIYTIFHFENSIHPAHFVVASRDHVLSFSQLSDKTLTEMIRAGKKMADRLMSEDSSIEKYSIVELVDEGGHFHIHFLPRLKTETKDIRPFVFDSDGWAGTLKPYVWNIQDVQMLTKKFDAKKLEELS